MATGTILDTSLVEALGIAAATGLGILLLSSLSVRALAEADKARADGQPARAAVWAAIALAGAAAAIAGVAAGLVLVAKG